MLIHSINTIGAKTIHLFIQLYEIMAFHIRIVSYLFHPKHYSQKTLNRFVSSIYYTTIIVIPYFILVAFFFGSIGVGFIISLATQYNVHVQIGSILVNFVIEHFSILFSALFLSFRSKLFFVNGVDKKTIIAPIFSFIISTLTLSILFSLIAISSGFVFTFFFMNMEFHTYKYLIYSALQVQDIIIMLIKSVLIGFSISIIPIYSMQKFNAHKNTVFHVLLALFFIELFFILTLKVIDAL